MCFCLFQVMFYTFVLLTPDVNYYYLMIITVTTCFNDLFLQYVSPLNNVHISGFSSAVMVMLLTCDMILECDMK